MRGFIVLVLMGLVLGAVLVNQVDQGGGYVYASLGDVVVETSVWFGDHNSDVRKQTTPTTTRSLPAELVFFGADSDVARATLCILTTHTVRYFLNLFTGRQKRLGFGNNLIAQRLLCEGIRI